MKKSGLALTANSHGERSDFFVIVSFEEQAREAKGDSTPNCSQEIEIKQASYTPISIFLSVST